MRWMAMVLVAACADQDGPSSGPYARLDQLDLLLQRAECTRYVRCGVFADQATCEATFPRGHGDLFLSPALSHEREAGHLIYDGAKVQGCLDAIAAASCSPYAAVLYDSLRSCVQRSIMPRLADGEACEHDWACSSGACEGCDWANTCCSGTCGPPSYPRAVFDVGLGGACGTFGACAPGLFCDDNGDQTCKHLIAEGQPCEEPAGPGESYLLRCADGLDCDIDNGLCSRPPTLGEHCTFACDSVAELCSSQGVCIAQTAAGDACVDSLDCPSWLRCTHGSCTASKSGDPCPCADSSTYCDSTDPQNPLCAPYRRDGEVCTAFYQCRSGFCDEGRCSSC